MRSIIFALCLALALAGQALLAGQAGAERRIGLVIGVDRYAALPAYAQLDKAVADARAVRDVLSRRLGFHHVVYGENTTLAETRDLLIDFSRRLQPGDLAFVFFAGHGANIRLANYLLPSDLPPMRDVASEAQVRLEEENMIERSISEERVRELITLSGARAAIVVLDACRNNIFREALAAAGPKGRSLAATTRVGGARPIERPQSLGRTQFLSLYSASPGQQALDSLGREDRHPNSPFTRVLVERLPTPGVKVYEIMRELRGEVARQARSIGHEQVPAISDEALDEVVLVGGAAAASRPQPAAPAVHQPAIAPPAPAPAAASPAAQAPTALPAAAPRAIDGGWSGWRLAVRSGAAISITAIAHSPDWRIAAASYRDQSIRFWSLTDGRLLATVGGIGEVPTELAFDPKGQLVAGNSGGGVQLWSATSFKPGLVLPIGPGRVSALAFSEDGSAIIVRVARGAVRAFELASRQEREATPADAAMLTAGSRRIARNTTMSLASTSGSIRFNRGRRGAEPVQLLALRGGEWAAIAEDGLTHIGSAKAIAAFELTKGRDRLAPTEDFLRAFARPDGLPRP